MATKAETGQLIDALTVRGINLLRLSSHIKAKVTTQLNKAQRQIFARIQAEDFEKLTNYQQRRARILVDEIATTVHSSYEVIKEKMADELNALAGDEVAFLEGALIKAGVKLDGLPGSEVMAKIYQKSLIPLGQNGLSAPPDDWWDAQDANARFRISNIIRQGITEGTAGGKITRAVASEFDISKQHAATLVQTTVARVANNARMSLYDRNDDIVDGYMHLSTLDGRTSDVCIARSGLRWENDKQHTPYGHKQAFKVPPLHPRCRSTMLPLLDGVDEEIDGTQSSIDGQVSAGLNFEKWMEGKSKAFADDVLGPGRAELWRDGKITLVDLLNQDGRPLSLKELRAKYD